MGKEKLSASQNKALEKANLILKWLDENCGEQEIIANDVTYQNPSTAIASHRATLNSQKPLTRAWKSYYMNIYNLKKSIENGIENN